MHALVVDDDAVSLLVVRHILERAGWTVTTAASKDEALALVAALDAPPSVTICDYHMPGGSGLDLYAALQAQGVTAPFLLLTGIGEQTELTDDRVNSVAGFLTKPVHSTHLLAAIAAATSSSPLPTEGHAAF